MFSTSRVGLHVAARRENKVLLLLASAVQGSSKLETDITASIHKAVKSTKGLSPSAKNVKIITMGTKVTLQGAVTSDSEKSTIESLAQSSAGVTTVDDQLQVITK